MSRTRWTVAWPLAAATAAAALAAGRAFDGTVEWLVVPLLVLTGAWMLDPRADIRLRQVPVAGIIALLAVAAVLSFVRLDLAARDHHGSLRSAPIDGGSDQIDFTAMAYTWWRYTTPGTSADAAIPEAVLAWSAERDTSGTLSSLWSAFPVDADGPRSYAFRPHLYPIVLGSVFKAVGYDPTLGPVLNGAIYAATSVALFLMLSRWVSLFAGYLAVAFFLSIRLIQLWAFQTMPETLVGLLVTVFTWALVELLADGVRHRWTLPLLAGAAGGLLALTKQIFVIAVFAVMISTLLWALSRARRQVPRVGAATAITLIVLLPWLGYNVGATGRLDLMLGTAGWHDMPSVYSQEYLDGGDQYRIREEIFTAYESRTGRALVDHVDRAVAGREIFLANLRAGEYWARLPGLVAHKYAGALANSSLFDQTLRLLAIAGLALFVVARDRLELSVTASTMLVLGAMMAAPFVIAVLTFPDFGRLVLASWIPTVVVAAGSLGVTINRAVAVAGRR